MKVLSVRTLYSFSFNLHLLEYVHNYTNTLFWGLPSFPKFLVNNFRFTLSAKSAVILRQFPARYASFPVLMIRLLIIELMGG